MKTTLLPEPLESATRLCARLGEPDNAISGVLMQLLDRVEAMVAVKEIATGRYVHASTRMAALFGREPPEMLGVTDFELIEPNQAGLLRSADHAALAGGVASPVSHRIEMSGQRREFSVARMAIPRGAALAPSHLVSVWFEVTRAHQRDEQLRTLLGQLEQQQAANESLRRAGQAPSVRDDMVGLYQRAHFDDQLRREVDLSAREHRLFALVAIVLDPLAENVRERGTEGRTRVLEALGRLLRSNTRAMDASCRIDEDRFAVLLSGVGLATAHSRMEGLRRQCATQIVALDGQDLRFSVAMGVASFPHTASTQEALVKAADVALAEAVRRGGNHVALASIQFEPG